MKTPTRTGGESGFALVITLLLLALLVLAVYGLSTLVRVNGEIATMAVYRAQARENARLGLARGLAELQRNAGADARLTGMSGIAGGEGAMRHWCGVWGEDGMGATWLVSGATSAGAPALTGETIELVSSGSVGSGAVDAEHVSAGKIPLIVAESRATPGLATRVGSLAYLVSDEGVKISAWIPPAERPAFGTMVTLPSGPSSVAELKEAVETSADGAARILSFEQLSLLPKPSGGFPTWTTMRQSFHHVTLTARTLAPSGGAYVTGAVNLNTTSAIVWRGIVETYNAEVGDEEARIAPTQVASVAAKIGSGIAAAGAPFRTVGDFGASGTLAEALPPRITPEQFMAVMSLRLAVRSDTFRVRAYGDAINPVDGVAIEAIAYCEAIVQRTPDLAPDGSGRTFVVVLFRWLGPTDI